MLSKIRKIILLILGLAGLLTLVPIIILTYLYKTADLQKPTNMPQINDSVLVCQNGVRAFNGDTLRLSKSGLWEMKLSGDPYKRGVSFGKLAEDLIYQQEKCFVDQIKAMVPSKTYLGMLRYFVLAFNHSLGKYVDKEFREEIYGVSQSCSNDFNFVCEPYERQMNYHSAHDIGHVMQDYMLVGCTSFAAWDNSTVDGSLIIGRNFDFYVNDDFAKNKIVIFCNPSNGYKYASVSWPGMVGVLSGMNEKGLTVTINASKSAIPTSSATPISIFAREVLQYAQNIDEAIAIAKRRKTFVSESVLIGSAVDGKAVVIEKAPNRMGIVSVDTSFVISTNHYQSETFANDQRNLDNIETSDSYNRYKRVEQLLNRKFPINEHSAVAVLRDYKGLNDTVLGWTNEQAINQFIAHHSVVFNATKLKMWVSTSPWQVGEYVAYDLKEIFANKLSFAHEITTTKETIPADDSISILDLTKIKEYKKLSSSMRKAIRINAELDSTMINYFEKLNPHFYGAYELIGDYYLSIGDSLTAVQKWDMALTKAIPRQSDLQRLEEKVNNLPPIILFEPDSLRTDSLAVEKIAKTQIK